MLKIGLSLFPQLQSNEPPPWNPSKLFPNAEKGYWAGGYDPGKGRVWQDITVPSANDGSVVGLVWDISKGTRLGNNIIPNPTFDADLSDWTVEGTAWEWDNGRAKLNNSNTSNDLLRKLSFLPQGFWLWEVDMEFASGTLRTAFANSFPATIDKNTTARHKWIVYNPATTLRSISMYRQVTFTTVWLDNFSCRKLPGNPAYQGTAGSKPLLRYDSDSGKWYLKDDGGKSLLTVLPAGNYEVAWIDLDGYIYTDSITSDGSTGVNTLLSEDQVDVIIREGNFTEDELNNFANYWNAVYPEQEEG